MDAIDAGEPLAEIYAQMVGGSVPLHSGDALSSVRMVAADLLDTDRIHLFFAEDTEHAKLHFLAVPSKVMHDADRLQQGFMTPLALAMPGVAGHRGEGAYLVAIDSLDANAAVAVYQRGDLRLYVNDRVSLQQMLEDLGLPLHDVTQEPGQPLQSTRERLRLYGDYVSREVARVSGLVLVVCGLMHWGLSAAAGYMTQVHDQGVRQQRESLKAVVTELKLVSPLSEQLARLDSLSSVVVKSGGWIDHYRLTDGQEQFELHVPEWTSRSALSELGQDIRTELSDKPGMLRVTRDAAGGAGFAVPAAASPAATPATTPTTDAASPAAAAAPAASAAVAPVGAPASVSKATR